MAMTALSSRATCRYAARLLLARRSCANLIPRLWLQTDNVRGHSKLCGRRADRRREHRLTSRNAKAPPSDDNKPQTGTWTALPPEDDGPGTDRGSFRRV